MEKLGWWHQHRNAVLGSLGVDNGDVRTSQTTPGPEEWDFGELSAGLRSSSPPIPVPRVRNPEIRCTKHLGLRLSDLGILDTQGLKF